MEYTVRWAKREEWDAAISLIWKTFLRFDAAECTEQGIQSFRDFIMDPDLKHWRKAITDAASDEA